MAADKSAVVGGFVLGGLALVVGAILFFGGTRLFEHSTRAVVVFEASVAGLDVGAPVTFRGVRVGSVQDIAVHVSPQGWGRIYAYLELLPSKVTIEESGLPSKEVDLRNAVAKGLRAELNLQSFVTGQLRVDLDLRPDTPARLVPVDVGGVPQIPAIPSDLQRLQNAIAKLPLQDLAHAALRTLDSGDRLIGHLDSKVGPLAEKVDRTLDAANVTMETAAEAAARLQSDGSRTLGALDQFLEHAQRQVDSRGADLATTLETANRTLREIEVLGQSTNSLVSQRSRVRGDLEAAARDLAATAGSLRGFAEQVDRNPSTLVRGTGK